MRDLTNKRFGKLVVQNGFSRNGRKFWNCLCDCGNVKVARTDYLLNSKTTHCGCEKKGIFKDLTNKRFGRLVAKSYFKKETPSKTYWICECDCGNTTTVRVDVLSSKTTLSCGCLQSETLESGRKIRENRRIANVDVTQLKRKLSKRNKSGHKGVCYKKSSKAWYATLGIRGEGFEVRCNSKEEAIQTRKELEERFHKPYIEAYKDKINDDS